MLTTKVRPVIFATVLALLATGLLVIYINSVKASLIEGGEKKPVIIAVTDIPAGTTGEEIINRNLVKQELIPQQYLAKDALDKTSDLSRSVLLVPVSSGQPLTRNVFRPVSSSDLAYQLKPGYVALTVALNDADSVNGKVKPGDKVMILVTLDAGASGKDLSRVLLKNVTVLAVSDVAKSGLSSATSKQAITLSVQPAEAEKIALAERKGVLKLAIQGDANLPETSGQTLETLW